VPPARLVSSIVAAGDAGVRSAVNALFAAKVAELDPLEAPDFL